MRALDGCESEEEQAQPHGQRHWDMSNGKQCGQREERAGGGDVIVTLTHMQSWKGLRCADVLPAICAM